jgi:hypothetical protein
MNNLSRYDGQKYLLSGIASLYIGVLIILIILSGSLKYTTNTESFFYCLYLVSWPCVFFVTTASVIIGLFVFAEYCFDSYKESKRSLRLSIDAKKSLKQFDEIK